MTSWRSFLFRRILGRLRIGPDIVRHLSTFQRLGETLEVEAPGEMLPVGARTLFRAVRTQGGAQIRPGWVWPYWMERQLEPRSPSFVPRGHLPFATNVTHRNWTAVGNARSPWEAIVDPAGLVTSWFDGWSLDWWVCAGDRWTFPSLEASVRQELVEAAPVVRTSLDVGGGRIVEEAFTVRHGEDEFAVVSVRNETPVTVQVAFALRPYNPEGLAVVEALTVKGLTVLADGRPAILLPGPPARWGVSTFAGEDPSTVLRRGGRLPSAGRSVRDRAGMANAVFVYDVPSGGSAPVALPIAPERRTRLASIARWRARRLPRVDVRALPDGETIAREWSHRLARGMRVLLPDERLQRAVDANRAYLLLFHDGDDITPGPFTYHRFWFRDAAYQLAALDRWGLHEEAAEVIQSYPSRQRRDGFFYSQWREWDSNGAAIWTVAEHHRLAGDDDLVRAMLPSVGRGAEWIERKLRERRREAPELKGLLPAGISAEHLGPFDFYYWDDFWALAGLREAAWLLRSAGDEDAARAAEEVGGQLRADLFASLERAAARIGERVMPAGPGRGADAGMIGSLVAVWPLGLLDPDDPWVTATVERIRRDFVLGDAFYQGIAHTGLGTYLTLQLAFVELEAGDPVAWRRLRWMLDAATPTFTWPEAIHPQLPGGCMGDGHHGWAAADFLSFVRAVLVREARDGSIALMGLLPPEWAGRDVEVTDAPTHRGRVSYGLTWRDERPELAWEIEREGVTLRAPGLDSSWATNERTGSVLLSPVGSVRAP